MTASVLQRLVLGSTSVMALALAIQPAFAQAVAGQAATEQQATPEQAAAPQEDADAQSPDIVVTGTLLRGIAPVGTNVVSVSKADVVATGAASTNDLLAQIPQISNFNSFPRPSASFGQPIAQTNLRNLGASGGTTTLVLVNGHRIVGSGILQTYVDPTIVPPGLIERVEVIPDGGSSIYGSDAIGGVINFITRRRMNGVEANARYGWADGYDTVDGNVTVGRDWGSGSLSASYAYAWHNNITGLERDYVRQDLRPAGGSDLRAVTCAQPNIVVGSGVTAVNYALPGRVAGSQNRCDPSDYADIYPREERHSGFVTLDQTLSDTVSTNITAYYSQRQTTTLTAPLATNARITSANPFFQPVGTETSQGVQFNYLPVFGNVGPSNPARFDSWGVTPTFDFNLGNSWNLRALANYGRSYNYTYEAAINASAVNAALAGTTTATALNPYNLSATNPAVLANIRAFANISEAKQELAEGRLVLDGTLLALPGGDVRVAIGGEHHYENIQSAIAFGPLSAPKRNRVFASRDVTSVYGEVFVPIFGAGNAVPGIQALELTGSVRYDHYNDVGGTTNPKVGFNYRPVSWITVRGNYGTSFHAPSLADTTGAVDERVTFSPNANNRAAGSPASDQLRPFLFISGGNASLQPETAKTWSLGADVKPSFFNALTISATYYNIDFRNVISVNTGGIFGGTAFFADPTNAPFFILNPTLAQATAFSRGARADNFDSLASFFATNNPYAIYDFRRYNRGQIKQDGIDFAVNLNQPTGFGSINAGFSGTYTLNRRTKDAPTAPEVNRLNNGFNRLNFVGTLGGTAGPLTGRATITHSGGYPILGDALQSRVSAFNTVDLFLSLDLGKLGLMPDTALTFNVDNVADQDPPFRNAGTGFANGSTLGRLFAVGVRTKF